MWLNYRLNPKHKYHLLDTGMKPGYTDIQPRIESALAKILIDFIEKEAYLKKDQEAVDLMQKELEEIPEVWGHYGFANKEIEAEVIAKKQKEQQELIDLYVWCKKWHSQLTGEVDVFYDEGYRGYNLKQQELFQKEVDDVMIRIVKIRYYLWT